MSIFSLPFAARPRVRRAAGRDGGQRHAAWRLATQPPMGLPSSRPPRTPRRDPVDKPFRRPTDKRSRDSRRAPVVMSQEQYRVVNEIIERYPGLHTAGLDEKHRVVATINRALAARGLGDDYTTKKLTQKI